MINTFSRDVKDELIQKIQKYFEQKMDHVLGNFETEFLLDFLTEHLGPYYYNQGIHDVQTHLTAYLENINERIEELEKPLPKGDFS
ncbi:DUF2164 domain-containing protein [bacterium]|nr:DUF2164 domain-containing protein [bacterium]